MRNKFLVGVALAAAATFATALAPAKSAQGLAADLFPLAAAPAATFAGTGTGNIPDLPSGTTCQTAQGTPLNVTFNVTGVSGAVSSVALSMTGFHSWVGDITATLIAPNGASHSVFGRTGATTAGSSGDSSDFNGAYNFADANTTPPSGGWWQEATLQGAAVPLTPGNYRTTAAGGAGATNPQPATNMNASFAGVANANGTWTLRVTDGCALDTGNISAATLTVEGAAAVAQQHVVDFNGDGKTDFSVVRNTGGGAGGQITWFINLNGTATTYASAWGLSTDFFVPVDYDGDSKTDIAVWRPASAAAGGGKFYILQSNGNTLRIENFGLSGDDPSVVDDYDGDGKADVAVYRAGANAGDPSTWYFRGSLNNPSGNISYIPWGQNGDFPAPGDYDGDGKADFVIQRNNGGGQARFWMLQTTAGFSSVVYGTPTDVIVPGDYDGDGKTDIAVVRASAGQYNWYVRPSSTGVISGAPTATFGASATDFPAQGDYDGDGKTDVAVWRPSASAGASTFWVLGSTSGAFGLPFGQNGDYPVANYNRH
jgi:subtilisin-like proprotein convertase family protein